MPARNAVAGSEFGNIDPGIAVEPDLLPGRADMPPQILMTASARVAPERSSTRKIERGVGEKGARLGIHTQIDVRIGHAPVVTIGHHPGVLFVDVSRLR